MNLGRDLLQNLDVGPFLVGIVSFLAAGCFARILIPMITAQIKMRNSDQLMGIRMVHIVITGSLTVLLAWKAIGWFDFTLLDWTLFGAPWIRWPADLTLAVCLLIAAVYAVLAFSDSRLRPPIILGSLDDRRGSQYRPEVDVALKDALTIASRAEELDHQLRVLLAERTRVIGEDAHPHTPVAPSTARGG